jgi:hypothetical protein
MVDIPSLSHLRDVLVVSVKGPYPWASLLSGGDYDGDLAFVSWDSRLIPPAGCIERMPPPSAPTPPKSLVTPPPSVHTIQSLGVLQSNDPHAAISSAIVELFRSFSPTLGLLTQMHAFAAETYGVASAQALQLGWLCRSAVDSPKSGAKVRIPKAKQQAPPRLTRSEVLPLLREEYGAIQESFTLPKAERKPLDADLVLRFSEEVRQIAKREYAEWRKQMRECYTRGKNVEEVKSQFHHRFIHHCLKMEQKGYSRLLMASAYYVVGSESSSNSFAFR